MNTSLENKILNTVGADSILSSQLVQNLWNNYGKLLRLQLCGGDYQSIIVKHIQVPKETQHPKGFTTPLSHQRKMNSYQVESYWYQNYNARNLETISSLTPKCLGFFQEHNELILILEDLNTLGLDRVLTQVDFSQIKLIISWLAHFHAKFLQTNPTGLWESGSYWHLQTRPDELKALNDPSLKLLAPLIDARLKTCSYQTIIHGDAKLANFCFSSDLQQVAAVDFQYTGGGTGMKDLAYFVGSCLNDHECEALENDILDFYFQELKLAVDQYQTDEHQIDFNVLETEWRELYYFAWADFHRFLKGWSPAHWKINSYSEKVCAKVIQDIQHDLIFSSQSAAQSAGHLIMEYWKKDIQVDFKQASTLSSQVVTEVDIKSQKKIISMLEPFTKKYQLGILAEEDDQDQSRFHHSFFWAIDPLDGTLAFSEGKSGFAVSIALVSQSGQSVLGVVFDPVNENLYHAFKGKGAFLNKLEKINTQSTNSNIDHLNFYADLSIRQADNFQALQKNFQLYFCGGSVMNIMNVMQDLHGVYFKYPKKELGGCAIWDLAAASLILQEAGGSITSFTGKELNYNRKHSLYFNAEGLMVSHGLGIGQKLKSILENI
jgi:fructose-1,6-bisphosphatase/inositol monophosphatase family enzyme